ncbi:remorin [Artemisia annua]|uniref:Remorin n=1 Tax=Artemisia annua TaxID=35608 RepID=A0A2U1QKM3_ARTAN|nr:remorin [Artemisia annua]
MGAWSKAAVEKELDVYLDALLFVFTEFEPNDVLRVASDKIRAVIKGLEDLNKSSVVVKDDVINECRLKVENELQYICDNNVSHNQPFKDFLVHFKSSKKLQYHDDTCRILKINYGYGEVDKWYHLDVSLMIKDYKSKMENELNQICNKVSNPTIKQAFSRHLTDVVTAQIGKHGIHFMTLHPQRPNTLSTDTKALEFKQEKVKIQAWENHEKSKAEMEMKRMEAKAERLKSRAQEKYTNKLASTRRIAEEKRAKAEATMNEKAVKTCERADYTRRTGHLPSSFSVKLPSCSCCW